MKNVNLIPQPRRAAYAAVGVLVLAGLLAAVQGAQSAKSTIAFKHDEQPIARGQSEPTSFSGVVKRVAPSVVKITTETRSRRIAMNPGEFPGADDPALRRFFGDRGPELREPPQAGLGSDVIISTDGYIATNNHVVDGADKVTVTFQDGRELTARVVGRDPQTDVAVVKVDARDLPAITFTDSAKVEVGDRVLALGNPFGIGETVTAGIVSATSRRAGIGLAYEDFIQTDAAINPGNSGGPLVDIEGRLIGLNTAILSRSGGFQGVGLAVPANLVNHVTESLVQHGKVVRGFIGVHIQDITPALADSFGLKKRKGALVAEVQPGSPAAQAGIKSGDVITAIDGQAVNDANKLSLSVSAVAPDTKLGLDLLRDGQTERVQVVTAVKPNSRLTGSEENASASNDSEGVLNGVAVDDLDPASRREINFPSRLKGAVITGVAPDSAAARAGLKAGDVILEINKQPVASAKQAAELSAGAEGKKTLLKLCSRGGTVFVVVDESGSEKASS
ncbi:MAG: Do family serine endopeptidase [Opitutaceae bacterium]|nr:Do family serine endopeptidase [Opitutaceae bacterium]